MTRMTRDERIAQSLKSMMDFVMGESFERASDDLPKPTPPPARKPMNMDAIFEECKKRGSGRALEA